MLSPPVMCCANYEIHETIVAFAMASARGSSSVLEFSPTGDSWTGLYRQSTTSPRIYIFPQSPYRHELCGWLCSIYLILVVPPIYIWYSETTSWQSLWHLLWAVRSMFDFCACCCKHGSRGIVCWSKSEAPKMTTVPCPPLQQITGRHNLHYRSLFLFNLP